MLSKGDIKSVSFLGKKKLLAAFDLTLFTSVITRYVKYARAVSHP